VKIKTRAIAGLVPLVVGAPATGAASPAPAAGRHAPAVAASAPTCVSSANAGALSYDISGKAFGWVVAGTAWTRVAGDGAERVTLSVPMAATLTNSVELPAGYRSAALWHGFEAAIKVDVGGPASAIPLAATSRVLTLPAGDSYYFGQGTGRWTATATVYQCQKTAQDSYGWVLAASGGITGYTELTHAIVGCKQPVPDGTFSAVLQRSC
jgi:hypothetical protein